MKTFFAAWERMDGGFEDGISPVRIFGGSNRPITFHQGVFHKVQSPKQNTPAVRSQGTGSNALSTNASNSETEKSESEDTSETEEDDKPKRTKSERPIGMVFKFISEKSDVTCSFPLAACSTSEALFTKARKFFQVFNKNVEVSILSCRLPSQQEQRCLFEGSEGQFELFLTDVDELKSGNQRLIVEVKCVA